MTTSTITTSLPENAGGTQQRMPKSNEPVVSTVVITSGSTMIVESGIISGFDFTDPVNSSILTLIVRNGGSALVPFICSRYGTVSVVAGPDGAVLDAVAGGAANVTVLSGGIAVNTQLRGLVALDVKSGGYASNVSTINTLNNIVIDDGGLVRHIILSAGDTCSVNGESIDVSCHGGNQHVFSGGLAVSNFIGSSAQQSVDTNGTVISTIVSSGGTQYIGGGGFASSSVILPGGSQIVNGGRQSDTIIMSGATTSGAMLSAAQLTLFGSAICSGSTEVTDTDIIGGIMTISMAKDSEFSNIRITDGGILTVNGLFFSSHINNVSGVEISDGSLYLGQGVSATDIRLNAGLLSVASAATISELTVATGGSVLIASGAVIQGAVTFTPDQPATGSTILNFGGASLPAITWKLDLTARIVTGIYTLINSTALNQLTLLLPSGTATVNKTTPYSITETNQKIDFTLSNANGATELNIYGQYKLLYGWQKGDDYTLSAVNCRIINGLYGTASGVAVAGNVNADIRLTGTKNTGNIYCGGLNNTIVGNVNAAITGGTYSGTIYGGTFSGASNNTTGGDINLTVSGIVHQHNTAVTTGATNWLLGGGSARDGKTGTVSGGITLTISNSQLGYVVGGGSASGSGTVMSVGGTTTTLSGCTVSGNIYAGGYADSSGVSRVAGNALLVIDVSTAATTITGNIFGGGKYDATCTANVTGYSEIVFTGSGDLLSFSGTVKGGDVAGERRLKFTDYIGDFSGVVGEMDALILSGDTAAVFDYSFGCQKLVFDLTGRSAAAAGDAMFSVTEGFDFSDNSLEVIFDPGSMSSGQTKTFELIGLDTETPDILSVQILTPSGTVLASMDFGETVSSGIFSYEVDSSTGGIAFSCTKR